MDKVVINVLGMSCSHCENSVNEAISELDGVEDVRASAADKNVVVEYDSSKVSNKDIKNVIIDLGYEIIEEKSVYEQ